MHKSFARTIGSRLLMVVLAVVACACSGCLCAFERDWRAAQNSPAPADPLAGLWEGTWESHSNGHDGTLRAIITPQGHGCYAAQYQGTFACIVPFVYETTHTATSQSEVTHFAGEEDLGPVFGVYRMNGWADGRNFEAHYQADKDHGTFRMRRINPLGCGSIRCGDGT